MTNSPNVSLIVNESVRDALGLSHPICSNKVHIQSGIDWLCRAQDQTEDNGVAAWFSLLNGWQPSYIETTGYIINTFLDAEKYLNRPELRERAIQMADFLVEMQHDLGGYRTVVPSRAKDSVPTVFNTGQDLLGMTEIFQVTKNTKYLKSAVVAADFLLSIQEKDGSWLKYTYGSMKHTYHTRVAWGILEVWKLTKQEKYLTAALKNLNWAETQQLQNGWFKQNHLPKPNPSLPFTHTIAYAIEGFLWSGLLLKNKEYVDIAKKAALPLATYYLEKGFLPGVFDENWNSDASYTCLTGDAQLALVWLELYKYSHQVIFLKAARRMISLLKSVQPTEESAKDSVRGSIKGSLPIYGDLLRNTGYCRFAFLNWSTKFFLDAMLTDEQIRKNA